MPCLWDEPADPARRVTAALRLVVHALRGHGAAPGRRLDAGTDRAADAAARHGRDAAVHAGRHQRDGQGALARRSQGRRRLDHPGEHLPPVPAAGPRAHRAARRAAPVHGLGPADPDRLGRVPGRLARRPARRRRGRRDLPVAPRRVDPPVHARSTRPRSRRRSAPMSPSRSTSRSTRARRAPSWPTRPRGRIAGRSARWRRTRGPDQAMFGIVQGGLDPELRSGSRRGSSPAAVRRHLHRRAGRRRDARASATRRSTSPVRCWPTTRGRAT